MFDLVIEIRRIKYETVLTALLKNLEKDENIENVKYRTIALIEQAEAELCAIIENLPEEMKNRILARLINHSYHDFITDEMNRRLNKNNLPVRIGDVYVKLEDNGFLFVCEGMECADYGWIVKMLEEVNQDLNGAGKKIIKMAVQHISPDTIEKAVMALPKSFGEMAADKIQKELEKMGIHLKMERIFIEKYSPDKSASEKYVITAAELETGLIKALADCLKASGNSEKTADEKQH